MKQNFETGEIWIGQHPAVKMFCWRNLDQKNSNPAATPVVVTGTKLLKATENSELFDTILHQSALGTLLYLPRWTRPDITFAVSNITRFCSKAEHH